MPPQRLTRRAAGTRLAAALAASPWALSGCAIRGDDRTATAPAGRAAPSAVGPDLVVAADGSGQFRSVHAALQSIPPGNRERIVVLVKPGVYRERARVDAPFVTLRGEGAALSRIEFDHPDSAAPDAGNRAVLDIGPRAHDFVLEGLSVHNTQPQRGVHAFAILGRGDRTLIQDCAVLGLGNDTLSLWRGASEDAAGAGAVDAQQRPRHGGRYYHARLRVTGSVDFVCPRGWCYMVDSELLQVNPGATASMWHDGRDVPGKKFVLRHCRFDGPPGWVLARRHHDGHLIFIDCAFSERMRDLPPYRVNYAAGGNTTAPTGSPATELPNRYGDRFHYHGSHRDGGDYAWHRDNLAEAAAGLRADDVSARWTFGNTWDPERSMGPAISDFALRSDGFELVFAEPVCVKGRPDLRLADGAIAAFDGPLAGQRLSWQLGRRATRADLDSLMLQSGAVLATEAATTLRHARFDTVPT